MIITTRVNGIRVEAVRIGDGWEAQIMPNIDTMARPYEYRCTYAGPDPVGPLLAAMGDVLMHSTDYFTTLNATLGG